MESNNNGTLRREMSFPPTYEVLFAEDGNGNESIPPPEYRVLFPPSYQSFEEESVKVPEVAFAIEFEARRLHMIPR